ncbi:hypothetical protein ACFWTE_29115, partial [Nocardiopsis sp. NPDC058631]|uniref:hypothetical protein n=1 Tax=Nocardiopsis sp. NPDC058631 TaxID=3346566 RepID=UPI003650A99E
VRAGAADAIRDAAQAEADARAARTAADLAAQAAANAARPSPGGQTAPGTTGTSNPSRGEGSGGTGPRGTTNTREETARRTAEDARSRAQEARQTAREAAERAARATEDANQLAQRAQNLRDRADTTAQTAQEAADRAEEARELAQDARDTADGTVTAADNAAADARRAHQDAQQAAQKAEAAAERAAEAAETAREARDDAEALADSARKRAESVRKLLERIPAAVEPGRTSSGGNDGDRSDGGDQGGSDRSGDRGGSDTRRGTGGGGRGRGTDGDGRGGRGGRGGHDIVAFPMTEVPVRTGDPSPQAAADRLADAIRLGELASASIKDAISGYQRAQDLVNQTREAESRGRPDAQDLRAQAFEAQREANEAYRTYDHLAQRQADLLRPQGPTTVMAVLETTGGTSRDPGPVPLGGGDGDIRLGPLGTDSPVTRDGGPVDNRNTTGTESNRDPSRSNQEGTPLEGAPPPRPLPPLTYDGGFVPDRSGQSYDLGYLTTSTVLGPHMLFTEHLPGFVHDVLNGTPGMPDPARQKIVDSVVDTLNKEGPRPFLREGGHTVSTTHDGQTWSADIDLRPEDGDFYHVDLKPLSGDAKSQFLRLHSAGYGVDSSEAGSHDGGKTVGGKFTMSPLYVASAGGNDAGPIVSFGVRGTIDSRNISGSASTSANSASGIEPLGTPNLYVGDLHMRASVTSPGLTAPRVREGTAYNGLAMNLPGEVVSSSDAPVRIEPDNGPADTKGHRKPVNRPFIGTGHPLEITRFSPVPPMTGGETTGTTGGDTTSGDGGTDRSGEGDRSDGTTTTGGGRKGTLGTWLADRLLGPRPGGNPDSSRTPSKKERRDNQRREVIESTFDNDRVLQYLPQMVNSSAHIRVQFSENSVRTMQMWSVSTEYNRKDYTLGLADFVHSNTIAKNVSSTVKHSTMFSGSVGGGFGIWVDLPNGQSIRLDVPSVEYSATFKKSTEITLNTSGTSSHVVHAPSGHAAYDVKRDFYVQLDGEPEAHRFEGETVEMLTVEDARLLNGELPKTPAPTSTSTDGSAAPPRPPFPNLAVDRPTDLSGATVLGFGQASPVAPANNGGTTGATENTNTTTSTTGNTETADNGNTNATNTAGTTENNDTEGDTPDPHAPQGPFYDDLAYSLLSAISEKHPGMVIPDMARTRKDYAVRPSHMDPDAVRSFRERWGLRRNAGVAKENTLKVLKALSESGVKSGASDLPRDGIPVRLQETAVIDPTTVLKDRGLRPDHVTLRVYGEFDPLVHQFDTTASGGARFAGSSGISVTKGSGFTNSLSLNVGGSVRDDANGDARGVPGKLGNSMVALLTSLGFSKESAQGISRNAEETILFTGDSDVWTSRARFTARLFENDDLGMARDGRPQREHGSPLLGDGMETQMVLLTPKISPTASDSTRSDASTTDDWQALPTEQVRDMLALKPTTPDGTASDNRGGRWTVIRDGAVHTWGRLFGGGAETANPPQNTTAPLAVTTTATGTDNDQAVVLSPPPPPGDTANTTGTTSQTAPPGVERSGDGSPDDQPTQAPPTLDQLRAQGLHRTGGIIEHVKTHFDTGDRAVPGLLEQMYRAFSDTRSGLHEGYVRKRVSHLSRSPGNSKRLEDAMSSEVLAADKSLTSRSGSRSRYQISGGFRSPHDVRVTTATRAEMDTVTYFRPVDAQMRWGSSGETVLSTISSLTGSLGLKFGGSGARNPNPPSSEGSLPNEAVRPIPLVGPSLARTFFSRGTSHTQSTSFSSSVLFIPNNTKAYAFRASGRITLAIEFLKNWSIGPTLSWNTLFRGMTREVTDLVSGYVHSRDAQEEGMVMDRATREGDAVVLSPQPNPDKPEHARVRPGFENNGRQIQPADPEAAVQALVDALASNGLELTLGNGREALLKQVTTHLAQNPDPTAPLPVKVRALGPEPTPDSGPRPQRSSSTGKLYVQLTSNPEGTDISHVGQSGYYIESHTLKKTDANSQNRGTSTTKSLDATGLQPTPYAQDDQGPDGQPGDRPLFISPALAASSSTGDGRSSGQSQDDVHTTELHLNTPYARVRANTTLELKLTLDKPEIREDGNPRRPTYTGKAGSGRVDTLYAFAYMDFDPPATTTTTTSVTEGGTQGTGTDLLSPPPAPAATTSTDGIESTGTDRDAPPAPESGDTTGTTGERTGTGTTRRPGAPIYASWADALRTWARNAGPRPGNDSALALPVMVQDHGQALRDQANIVIARSVGWKPPVDTPEGEHADAARAYLADVYGMDPVYNEIDRSLSDEAVKALDQSASRNPAGVQFTDIDRIGWSRPMPSNHTEWGAKAVASSRGAKILDTQPDGQVSDSRARPRTNTAGHSHSTNTGLGSELRPAGLSTEAEGIPYDRHEGIYTGSVGPSSSSSHGAESGSNQAVKGYQESDKLRQGPVYLIEHDVTYAFAAGSKLKAPAAFHRNDPAVAPTPLHSRPTRWIVDDVTIRMAKWYSESDAIAMGFLTPDQAKDMAPSLNRLNQAREEFSKAEAAYADTRAPLEGLAERYAANPRDTGAEDAYNAQEEKYEKARQGFGKQTKALVETVKNTRTALGETGQGTDGGTAPPGRTSGGDGTGGTTTRTLPPADNTTATGTTATMVTGSTDNTGVTSETTTTTGGPLPSITVTPSDPAPAGPRQELVDRFRSELNLGVPESGTPAPDSDGFGNPRDGQDQNTDTVDARVDRASDAADTAVQEARDARDDANGLSTTLDRGRADLRDGLRLLTGSDSAAPATGAGGRAPAPGTDGTPSPGAVRQARDAREAADTAHGSATAADNDITTARNGAFARMPEPDRDAFIERAKTAASDAEDADTSASDARDTAGEHEDTVAEIENDLDETPPRYQELRTAVD